MFCLSKSNPSKSNLSKSNLSKSNLSRIACSSVASLLLLFASGGLSFAAELVNINAADVESIATALNGIGPAKAQAIVDYREQFGAFLQIQDISKVPGIGDVTLEQIKSLITLGDTVQ